MIDYLGYNLTEYKSFRQLELDYLKLRSENQSLHSQLITLKQAYEIKSQQLLQLKNQQIEQKIKLKNKNLKYKKLYKQLLQHIESTLSSIKTDQSHKKQTHLNRSIIETSSYDKSMFIHLQEAQNLQKVCNKLNQMKKDYLSVKQKNANLSKKMQTIDAQSQNKSLQKQKTELMIIKQIEHLQNQLQQLNQVNIQLEAKVNIRQKEKRKVDIELRQLKHDNAQLERNVSQLVKQKQERTQQDSEFALDFMTFQLQTVQSFFSRIAQSTKCSTDLSNMMSILYSDYEELSQIFREKLQIQYDLQELQQRYKSQKSSSVPEQTLLIETRRQIQAFRLQLLKQKEIVSFFRYKQFRQKEQYIEEHFQEYNKINQAQMKVKHYSYELQNRLYRQKHSNMSTCERFTTTNPTARDILAKRTAEGDKISHDFIKADYQGQTLDKDHSSLPNKKTSLRFKQTNNAEEIMNEIINNDKANLEKILKENRKSSIPFFLAR